jgi:hypothetical protein
MACSRDKAIWKTGDPITDYNDTKRPTMNGELDYAGGDRPERRRVYGHAEAA